LFVQYMNVLEMNILQAKKFLPSEILAYFQPLK
jgi:hypothetical protein